MIPNIVKGKGITGALAYVMGQGNDPQTGERLAAPIPGEESSRATLLGGQNFGFEIDSPDRLETARRIMEWQGLPQNQAGKTRKLDNDCFHASLSWGEGQKPSDDEMREAATEFLKAVGLERARAVFIKHDDTDHAHMHIVASRIDPETRRTLRMNYDQIAGQKWAAQWEKAHGQERSAGGKNLAGLMEALEQRDVEAVLGHLTKNEATFKEYDLTRALGYGEFSKEERAAFKTEILTHKSVVGLRETTEGEVVRYTTRGVLAAEMALNRSAASLADNTRHGVDERKLDKLAADFTLKPEQADAFRHLTKESGFAVLWGEAGTGKSHTLKAVRSVYEAEGYKVEGLSWTNKVVGQMREDGFKNANTIASELMALEKGRKDWTSKTAVIIDEAGMVSTEHLARLAAAADKSGAKLILVGDDRQLGSIERGGMFESLRVTHGAAVLKDVQRVKDAEQKTAFNQMHDYSFGEALKTFEARGGVHWSKSGSAALKEMAGQYADDLKAAPEKTRFMFAGTNKQVDSLNQLARGLHREQGLLGDDHSLKTSRGVEQFATGDRVQFTANGRTKAEKNAGLVNGNVGTITGIEETRLGATFVTVALDAPKGHAPKSLRFAVGGDAKAGEFNGLRHGYAGTVYKGQGATLDVSYVAYSDSPTMRGAGAYVALTRHREAAHIFAGREDVADLDAMAKGMARASPKRAASSFQIDAGARADLESRIADLTERRAAAGAVIDLAPDVAPKAAGKAINPRGMAGPDVAGGLSRATEKLSGIAGGVAKLADGVADYAGQAIDALADLFGGGSTAEPPPPPKVLSAAERQAAEVAAYTAAQHQQRLQRLQQDKTARGITGDLDMSEEEQRREEEKRSRDRGGQSL